MLKTNLFGFIWTSYGKYRIRQLRDKAIFVGLFILIVIIGIGWVFLRRFFGFN